MLGEPVRFPGAVGMLAGRLHRPDGPARATALFAHCFTCGKDIRAARRISQALADHGFAVLRFDFTGLGESEGDFEATDFSSNLDDLVAAAAWLAQAVAPPALLVGHSLGGAAVLAAAGRVPSCRAVATIAAPSTTTSLAGKLVAMGGPGTRVNIAGREFEVRPELLRDLQEQALERHVRDLGRALLVLHVPGDTFVGVEHATRIFAAARHPRSFVSLDQADHLLSRPEDADWVGHIVAAWASRYTG